MTATPHFDRVALIGIGLINSSIARLINRDGLAASMVCCARRQETLDEARTLELCDDYTTDPAEAVRGADLVVLGVPVGAIKSVAEAMQGGLQAGAIVTDVGSVKATVINDLKTVLPAGVHFVPGHPVAGTEHSGPGAGFAELFDGRWCILTPEEATDEAAVEKVRAFWAHAGMRVDLMDAKHHDQVLAITSHLPHLIAYNIVGTAHDLETVTEREVIKYSAGGFRDFTRIAASDPVMWRDVFLNNREAVLEMLGRFSEDLASLQRAIRWSDGDALEELFTRTREIRRSLIEAKQA
jgi:cyclohexadieny/prephenate dehydrogenase